MVNALNENVEKTFKKKQSTLDHQLNDTAKLSCVKSDTVFFFRIAGQLYHPAETLTLVHFKMNNVMRFIYCLLISTGHFRLAKVKLWQCAIKARLAPQ